MDERYWNPLIETLPLEKLRALQFMKFKRALDWAYQNSPFYKSIYRAHFGDCRCCGSSILDTGLTEQYDLSQLEF